MRVGRKSGLSFGRRTRGIAIRNRQGRVAFKVKKRSRVRLTLRFSKPQKALGIAIARPTLKVSGKLARKARRHTSSTKLNLAATDIKGRTTHRAVKLKLSSGRAARRHKKK
jgi:hypothetical protein